MLVSHQMPHWSVHPHCVHCVQVPYNTVYHVTMHCLAYNPHEFSMKQLIQLSITKDEISCPVHKGMVSLELLVCSVLQCVALCYVCLLQSPDIIISDLQPSYHINKDDIIMDENKQVARDKHSPFYHLSHLSLFYHLSPSLCLTHSLTLFLVQLQFLAKADLVKCLRLCIKSSQQL